MYPNYEAFAPVAYTEFAIFALFVSGVSGALAAAVFKLRVRSLSAVKARSSERRFL
jgi:hypothetical protein